MNTLAYIGRAAKGHDECEKTGMTLWRASKHYLRTSKVGSPMRPSKIFGRDTTSDTFFTVSGMRRHPTP